MVWWANDTTWETQVDDRLEGRLQTQTFPVDDLVAMVQAGTVRIPSFQRGIRWSRQDVIKLFQSIIRGYPIGNLLLWKRPAAEVKGLRIGALRIDAPSTSEALYVVDGQQRLTSLASALSAAGEEDPLFGLVFDATSGEFLPHKSGASSSQIPLWVLFDLPKLLRWFTTHPELQEDPEVIERANGAAKAIREFRVPVYIVERSDPNILRDIFDRMNNYGKQLTRAEVFTALHEAEAGEKQPDQYGDFAEIAERVHARTGFGILDEDSIFLAILARRGADISREIRTEFSRDGQEFPGETAEMAQARAEDAIVRAIEFLQSDGDIPHFAMLPNRYLLIVLARFFAHFPDISAADRRQMRRWLWRTAARGPEFFKGSSTGALRTLAYKIVPGQLGKSISQLLDIVSSGQAPIGVSPRITDFKTNYAATRMLLAALWSRGPRRISRVQSVGALVQYSMDDLIAALGESATAVAQVPMIFPGRELDAEDRALAANRVLLLEPPHMLPEDLAEDLVFLARLERDGEAAEILRSHLISAEAAQALIAGDRSNFLQTRQRGLEEFFADFLSSRAEWEVRYQIPADELEVADRDDEFEESRVL